MLIGFMDCQWAPARVVQIKIKVENVLENIFSPMRTNLILNIIIFQAQRLVERRRDKVSRNVAPLFLEGEDIV